MKKLGVMANCTKKRAPEVFRRIAESAKRLGIELLADPATARLCRSGCKAVSLEKMFRSVDAMMALGGDGTVLRVARELNGRDIPVMGINIGGLGFLTSVAEGELDRALKCLARNDFLMSTRTVAEGVLVRGGRQVAQYRALNDIVVGSGPSLRVITLDVSIDGDYVTSYVCDGLIVSTPTGSTGHSLSAAGPILTPETPAFVISLICPHTLTSRPLVVPDSSEVSVAVAESAGKLLLSVDGQVGCPMKQGDRVKVRRSKKSVRFIHLPAHSYFQVLRQKLRWSGSNL